MSQPEAYCFVIQPFDRGPFDDRFDDVLVPAILAAGLAPYRVDRDAACVIPFEQIGAKIRGAAACVADISRDNPNVWLEVGLALAYEIPTVLICSEERSVFPFDVQHRVVVRYGLGSPRDFGRLAKDLTDRLRAARRVSDSLSPDEIEVLRIVADSPEGLNRGVSVDAVSEELSVLGRALVSSVAMAGLERLGMVVGHSVHEGAKLVRTYTATGRGLRRVESNRRLTLAEGDRDADPF